MLTKMIRRVFNPNTMKRTFSLLAVACLAIGLFTNCTTNNAPLTPEQRSEQIIQRAKRITDLAAFDTAIGFLNGKNNTAENRAVISGIKTQLQGFANSTNVTPADVAAYIAQLPIPQLKTLQGQLIAGGVLTIVDEVFSDRYQIDATKIGPVIQAAIGGFTRALQFAEANPYVPPAPKPKPTTNTIPVTP